MKKLKKLQLNRETLRNLSLDNLAAVEGGTGSFGCSYGCGGSNNSCPGVACNEN
jgi:natural product precursor